MIRGGFDIDGKVFILDKEIDIAFLVVGDRTGEYDRERLVGVGIREGMDGAQRGERDRICSLRRRRRHDDHRDEEKNEDADELHDRQCGKTRHPIAQFECSKFAPIASHPETGIDWERGPSQNRRAFIKFRAAQAWAGHTKGPAIQTLVFKSRGIIDRFMSDLGRFAARMRQLRGSGFEGFAGS